MGFIDWIKARMTKKTSAGAAPEAGQAKTQTGGEAAAPEPVPSGVSVTPRSVKPLKLASPESPLVRAAEARTAAEAVPAAPLPSKPLSFTLADLVPKLPDTLREQVAVDLQTALTISSDDIASDLTRGRATVPVTKLLDACPGIFGGLNPASLPERIALPLNKVVQQMGEFSTRLDQTPEEKPEQVYETPFLRGALRDSPEGGQPPLAGEKTEGAPTPPSLPKPPPLTSASPQPPVASLGSQTAPGTQPINRFATTIISAPHSRRKPPATVRASVAGGKIRVGGYTTSLIKPPSDEPQDAVKPAPPKRPAIPSKPEAGSAAPSTIKMTDSPIAKPKPPFPLAAAASASEPSSPPVAPLAPQEPEAPLSRRSAPFPSPFAKAPETVKVSMKPEFITWDDAPEAEDSSQKPVASEQPAATEPPAEATEETISIPLAAVVKALPIDQIDGDPDDIDPGVQVVLPIADVVGQLGRGRVSTTVGQMRATLPENASRIFGDTSDTAEITLPLREILAALPQDALRKRDDQVEDKPDTVFETPFSRKAAEDARRLAEEEAAEAAAGQKIAPTPAVAVPPFAVASPVKMKATPMTEASGLAPAARVPEPPAHAEEPLAAQEEKPSGVKPTVPPQPEPQSSPSAVRPKPPIPFISRRALQVQGREEEEEAKPPVTPLQQRVPMVSAEPAAIPPAEAQTTPSPAQPAPAPVARPTEPPAPVAPAPALEAAEFPAVESGSEADTRKANAVAALQEIFMTEEAMDARSVLAQITKLPGVAAAMLSTADGLKLAGSLDCKANLDALCAITPRFYSRLSQFAEETALGTVTSITLDASAALLSIFTCKGTSLFVEHQHREFAPGIRARLVSVARHLSDIYS